MAAINAILEREGLSSVEAQTPWEYWLGKIRTACENAPAMRDLAWTHSRCFESEELHAAVWAWEPDNSDVEFKVHPELLRAQGLVKSAEQAEAKEHDKKLMDRYATNIQARADNLLKRYLEGLPSAFRSDPKRPNHGDPSASESPEQSPPAMTAMSTDSHASADQHPQAPVGEDEYQPLDATLLAEASAVVGSLDPEDAFDRPLSLTALSGTVMRLWESAAEGSEVHQDILAVLESAVRSALDADEATGEQVSAFREALTALSQRRLVRGRAEDIRARFIDAGFGPLAFLETEDTEADGTES